MKILVRFVLLLLLLTFSNCKESSDLENTIDERRKNDLEYNAFVEYLKTKNISVCEIKEIRIRIKENAKNLADKKYPNSLAQHDKYIERITEKAIDTIKNKYNLKSGDWSKAWIYSDKYCN